MVVDDEPSVRDVLYELIGTYGYRVSSAGSGRDALAILQEDRADLIITDLMMPEMNGWQLLKRVKRQYPETAIVVLTGFISEEGEAILTNNEIHGYLTKPTNGQRLKDLLQALPIPRKPVGKVEVVVIDDNPDDLASITESLSKQGFDITTFQDPDNGLHHILETPPDLAIIDVMMPNTNGFELCKIIRQTETTAKMPILILTASPSRENVEKALELAVNGFVAKPFNPRNLSEKVLQVIRQSQFKP